MFVYAITITCKLGWDSFYCRCKLLKVLLKEELELK